jgi:plasmid maintenance system killer protein
MRELRFGAHPADGLIDYCQASLYSIDVIKSFRHKGLEQFYRTGSRGGIQPAHAKKLRLMLTALDNAAQASDLNAPG